MKTQTIDTTALTFTDSTLDNLINVRDIAFLIDVFSSPLIDSIQWNAPLVKLVRFNNNKYCNKSK